MKFLIIIMGAVVHRIADVPENAAMKIAAWWTAEKDQMVEDHLSVVIKEQEVFKGAILLRRASISAIQISPIVNDKPSEKDTGAKGSAY